MPENILNDFEKEFVKFLDRDFVQCFQQMRHYDGQIIDICKFAFTAYTALIGTAFALFRYGVDNKIDYRAPASLILCVGLLLGICLVALLVRNRVYFVVVTRYVNEHRKFFPAQRPLGFENQTKMYTNFQQPPYFNWRSSQELMLYTLALLNAGLFAGMLVIAKNGSLDHWAIIGLLGFCAFVLQLATSIAYLRSREHKSASKAVSGAV